MWYTWERDTMLNGTTAPYVSGTKGTNFETRCVIPIVGFLPSLRIRGSDEIMSSGALHQNNKCLSPINIIHT